MIVAITRARPANICITLLTSMIYHWRVKSSSLNVWKHCGQQKHHQGFPVWTLRVYFQVGWIGLVGFSGELGWTSDLIRSGGESQTVIPLRVSTLYYFNCNKTNHLQLTRPTNLKHLLCILIGGWIIWESHAWKLIVWVRQSVTTLRGALWALLRASDSSRIH